MDSEKIEEKYADGIVSISMAGGTVRCEFGSFIPPATTKNDKDKDNSSDPKFEKNLRLVMTPQGAYQAATVLQNFVKQLEEKGIIKITEKKDDKKKQ